MNETKGCFWLYKGDVRVTGIYGIFCQFVPAPKIYTITEEQKKIVYSNLAHKVARLNGSKTLEGVPIIGELSKVTDVERPEFDQVRIYSLNEELIETRLITELEE